MVFRTQCWYFPVIPSYRHLTSYGQSIQTKKRETFIDTIFSSLLVPNPNFTMPTKEQRKQLQLALISAFPERSLLEQLLDYELDKKLNRITQDSNLETVVYQLIQRAQAEGWLVDLVRAARKENPLNLQLEAIALELLSPEIPSVPKPSLSDFVTVVKISTQQPKILVSGAFVLIAGVTTLLSVFNFFADTNNSTSPSKPSLPTFEQPAIEKQPTLPLPVFKDTPNPSVSNQRKFKFADVDISFLKGKKVKYAGSTVSAVLLCNSKSSGDTGIHHQLAYPNFQLEYILPNDRKPPNSGEGIKMLISDRVDFVIASRDLTKNEKLEVKNKNFKLEKILVAKYPIAIVTNSDLDVSSTGSLTLKNVADIFTGKISNFIELGGSFINIIPVVHEAEKNADFPFIVNVVGDRDIKPARNTDFVKSTTIALRKVEKDKRRIYRAPAPLSFGQIPQSLQTIPIKIDNHKSALPYKERNFNPLKNCHDLNSIELTPTPINTEYPKELQEPIYVIYKHYKNNKISFSERAGKTYAELLKTTQGQKMLKHIGFRGFDE